MRDHIYELDGVEYADPGKRNETLRVIATESVSLIKFYLMYLTLNFVLIIVFHQYPRKLRKLTFQEVRNL